MLIFGLFWTWRTVDQFVCSALYQLPGVRTSIRVPLTGTGSVSGKYYHHRYWNMVLANGMAEKFWVYAAANTEEGHTCSTSSFPESGGRAVYHREEGFRWICL